MRRDFLRAAAFLWMTPVAAALSSLLIASRDDASNVSVPTAASALFVRVRNSERTALLRRRRRSFCLLRLIWLLMFATEDLATRCAGRRSAIRARSEDAVTQSSPAKS